MNDFDSYSDYGASRSRHGTGVLWLFFILGAAHGLVYWFAAFGHAGLGIYMPLPGRLLVTQASEAFWLPLVFSAAMLIASLMGKPGAAMLSGGLSLVCDVILAWTLKPLVLGSLSLELYGDWFSIPQIVQALSLSESVILFKLGIGVYIMTGIDLVCVLMMLSIGNNLGGIFIGRKRFRAETDYFGDDRSGNIQM